LSTEVFNNEFSSWLELPSKMTIDDNRDDEVKCLVPRSAVSPLVNRWVGFFNHLRLRVLCLALLGDGRWMTVVEDPTQGM